MNHKTYFEEIGAWPTGRGGRSLRMAYSYISGFIVSIILTLLAFGLVSKHTLSLPTMVTAIVVLACMQFILQLVLFLHLGKEAEARERLVILGCTVFIVGILVSGSLWIMLKLDSRMMLDPVQMDQYMSSQSGL